MEEKYIYPRGDEYNYVIPISRKEEFHADAKSSYDNFDNGFYAKWNQYLVKIEQ